MSLKIYSFHSGSTKDENNVISVLWLWFLSYPIWWSIINSTIFISGFLVHTIFCSFWRPVLESDWIYCELRTISPPNAAWKWTSWAFLSCKICVENKNIDENSPNTVPWRGLDNENSRLLRKCLSSHQGLNSVQRSPQLSVLSSWFESSNALHRGLGIRYPLLNLEQVKTQFVLPFPGLALSKYCLVSLIP